MSQLHGRSFSAAAAALAGILGMAAFLAALQFVPAQAQFPHNRTMQKVAVWPAAGGLQSIHAVWTFDVEESTAPIDLTTDVVLHINGVPVESRRETAMVHAGAGFGCGSAPCGGDCGTVGLEGGDASLLCYKDGECTPEHCDCDCGFWIDSEFPGQPLATGDEIMVILYPAPGALPDGDTTDDQLSTPFHGRPIGWDRGVEEVRLVDVGGGLYDVYVWGGVAWESQAGFSNLDLTLELSLNGTTIAAQDVPSTVDAIFDQSCFQMGCGANCGAHNGVPRSCDPYLWWDCACHAGWLAIFPGLGAAVGDEITVILRPAPGALPELPGTNENDSGTLVCCEAAGMDPAGETQAGFRLDQNQPNPFAPLTSIRFEIDEEAAARVAVFDAGGRRVRTLLDRSLAAGRWSVTWDGRTESGETAAPGVYYYKLETDRGMQARRMTLLGR